jgi:hypothetical protein
MSATYTEPYGLNRFWLGSLLGVFFPIAFFLLYFLFRFKDLSFSQYLQFLFQTGKYVHVISFAVFSNIMPFMFFVRSNRFKSGRGVMTITILFVVAIFIMKLSM